ncbi:amylo-alpha-1,6-glucosidase [Thermogemmatispora sp.]|uniref:amylo-alpha-1,6-glucosidase n=1 Tax=Thermogemmatispora sp. TaxID=1968838 RepID=UPI0035E4078B
MMKSTHDPEHAALLVRWLERGRAWLDELQTPGGLHASSAADQYPALYGRDTLWSILLVLEAARLRPGDSALANWAAAFAAHGLQALASTQGTTERDENEEQPGKIIHEYWPEPRRWLASEWPLWEGRYYGSVDATYLFLITAATVWQQVEGGRQVIERLWPHVMAALDWTLKYGDVDGDGLVEVLPRQPRGLGLRNQVWKDSNDALLLEDGAPPSPPVAWVELQGYALAAFREIRPLLQEAGGETALLRELEERMERLRRGLPRFWLPGEGCPAMALSPEKQAIPLVASNMGHLLWCAALEEPYASRTAERLLQPDLLTPWGIRTLSRSSYAFDPYSYHRGTVWPFDNAIIASALWRMGRRDQARLLSQRLLEAIALFDSPVELYCVLPPEWILTPTTGGAEALAVYTRACKIQAWTAAALMLAAAQLLSEASRAES